IFSLQHKQVLVKLQRFHCL
ncbi:putative ATP-dependent RNA helicase RhlE domain protein, partial [Vibrio parahaemolyticus AQ3810]